MLVPFVMSRNESEYLLPFDRSFLWLLGAVPLLFVATGLWAQPVAAWLAPVVLLRFVRDQPIGRGCAAAALVLGAVSGVTWYGAAGQVLQAPLSYVVGAALGVAAALPYLLDRLLASRLSGLAATLVFPTAAVTVEYAASFGPFGTWGSAAYTQQNLALLQLTSVTGIWGVTFLLHWTAGVANAVWEDGLAPSVRGAAGLWAGLLAAVLLIGSARLAGEASPDAVPVAAVAGRYDAPSFWRMHRRAESRAAVRDSARVIQRAYLRLARRAARAGARLVTWPEAAVPVPREDTDAFLDRARTLAADHDVYLAMGVNAVPRPESDVPLHNKVVWMGPDGTVRAEGLKTHLVPGEPGRAGTGRLPRVPAPTGTWTSAVCYDLDFPTLIRQAGRQEMSLLVAPSNDWAAIADRHAHMARVRAIENGTALLRPTSNGVTLATGPLGRTRLRTNHVTTQEDIQMAHLPMEGPSTIYAAVGDVVAWGAGLGLLLLAGGAYARSWSPVRATPAHSNAA
jgi:apolipoprotein N-acyltransferase